MVTDCVRLTVTVVISCRQCTEVVVSTRRYTEELDGELLCITHIRHLNDFPVFAELGAGDGESAARRPTRAA